MKGWVHLIEHTVSLTALVLGTAQDGGLPQAGCHCQACERARLDPRFARRVSSLALLSGSGKAYLVDVTPDLPAQLDLLYGRCPDEARLLDGLFLTHAHIGHYAGLIHFGREVMGMKELPTWCSKSMWEFLSANAPCSQLVSLRNLVAAEHLGDNQIVHIERGLSVIPLEVPHRNEFADTHGFIIVGPQRRLLYLPDIDSWNQWRHDIRDVVRSVDTALIDGTFYSTDEIRERGRDPKEVPHPPILDTMAWLQEVVDGGALVYFTHLNHTNAALDPSSAAYRQVIDRGFRVLADGDEIIL